MAVKSTEKPNFTRKGSEGEEVAIGIRVPHAEGPWGTWGTSTGSCNSKAKCTRTIGMFNLTRPSQFILLGLSSRPQDQKPLFILFLVMYLVTLMGNVLIILAIHSDPRLQNPMYFFLSILSFADICYATVIVPKMLMNFLSETKSIAYAECLTQMYFFLVFGNIDSYLLAAMAIDRYVAICNPFHYITIMSHRRCVLLLSFSIAFSCLHSLVHVLLVNRLTFCASNVIHHFFCDVNPVLKLSCSSTSINELVAMTEGMASVMAPFACIVISYLQILLTVLKIPSAAGKHKAFSTCSSHLTVVTLFYGSISYVYFQPLSSYTVNNRVATIMYTVLTSMLNPFIYSLRNKDMKRGLGKLIIKIKSQIDKLSSTEPNKIGGS
ncbi:olfactory receptor 1L3-like [Echinops telfairi]|uniref:Olfactory receptor n=1 Tax=Echinops telfairi TaxID=9371 RepID=A0ABM0J1B4_ECHTE|nr:olfactory receptor 1L3-like [Echinops telfairi]